MCVYMSRLCTFHSYMNEWAWLRSWFFNCFQLILPAYTRRCTVFASAVLFLYLEAWVFFLFVVSGYCFFILACEFDCHDNISVCFHWQRIWQVNKEERITCVTSHMLPTVSLVLTTWEIILPWKVILSLFYN
jgi:hypothetical protein